MKIRLAKTAGFCMGVRRAVDMVLDLQRELPPEPIVTYGPLIHNPQALELLRSRGIGEVRSLPEISQGTVVIRAHGISPQERASLAAKGVGIIDATCPRVARVQAVIRKHARKGHFCVIIGDEDHPEVRGLIGFASAGGLAIPESSEDLFAKIPKDRELCIVAQTTQEVETFESIVADLKKNYPALHVYDTICDSTRRRQAEVKRMCEQVDAIVVVGGKGSGNTQRLAKIAQAHGKKSLHIETVEDLPTAALTGANVIGVTAGASTPNWQILRVIERLKEIGMSRSGPLKKLRRIGDISVMTYGWAAAAGGGLTAVCLTLQDQKITFLPLAVAMLFVFSMHLLNRIQERQGAVRFNTPEIASFYVRHGTVLSTLGIISSIAAIALSYQMGLIACVLLTTMLILGRMYTIPLKNKFLAGMKWKSLKDLPGSKTPLVALGWAAVAAILPVLDQARLNFAALAVAFTFAVITVFWRTALSDLLDIQGDRIVGRETIPILIGIRRTRQLLLGLLIFQAVLLVVTSYAGVITSVGYLLVIQTAVYAGLFVIYKRRHLVDRLFFEGMVDGNIVASGIISIVYGALTGI